MANTAIDTQQKRPALKRVLRMLIDDCSALWVGRLNTYHLGRADVTGFEPRSSDFMDLTQARKALGDG